MKIKLTPDKSVEGEVIGFVPMSEPWCEYHLDNGNVLRFRSTVNRVIKLQEKNQDGSDGYIVQTNQQVVVDEKETV